MNSDPEKKVIDGQAFRNAREAIGWSVRQVADQIWMDERNLRACEAGERSIPAEALSWITKLSAVHEANPAPIVSTKRLRRTRPRR